MSRKESTQDEALKTTQSFVGSRVWGSRVPKIVLDNADAVIDTAVRFAAMRMWL